MKIAFALMAGLPLLAGCPLQPDVVYDSGVTPDSGSNTDAGVDAGTAMGSISASLVTSSTPQTQVTWTGTDLAFSQQDVSTGSATLRGDSLANGHLVLQLIGLMPGQAVGAWTLASYSTADSNEVWSCSVGASALCTVSVAVTSYDGINLSGSFNAQFNQASVGTGVAALSGGVFSISFAQ